MNDHLAEITQTIIGRINTAISFAAPLAFGDPIPDTSIYSLEDFPRIDQEAQEAYDLALIDEELKEQAQILAEASDRLSALFTMLCDLIPARDAAQYDFSTVSMVLPYLTFTISALSDIVDGLNANMVSMAKGQAKELESGSISKNPMYRRIFDFIVESLSGYIDFFDSVKEFQQYVVHQLDSFCKGEKYRPFVFSFSDPPSKLMCSLDGRSLSIWHSSGWEMSVDRNGNVNGSLNSDDLNVTDMKLNIVEPDAYYYNEEDEM